MSIHMATLTRKKTVIHNKTVDSKVITNYINTFRNTLGIFLNNGVGTKITISDLSSCVFVCIELELGILDSTTFGKSFNSTRIAFQHYGFINALAELGETEGTRVVIQKNKIALIKDKSMKFWNEDLAEYDAREIAQHIIKSNNKNGVE